MKTNVEWYGPVAREWHVGRGARRATASACLLLGLVLGLATGPSSLQGQERIDERRPLAADGRLDLQAVNHAVRVEAWDQNEVHLTGTLDPSVQRLEVSGSDRALTIRIEHERGSRGGSAAGTLELRVPRNAQLSVGTVSGDLVFDGVTGTVRGQTVSGSIRLNGTPSHAELQAVSGSIESTGAVADIRIQAVSGNIRVRRATSRVDVQVVSGRIEVEGDAPLERVRANTVSGEVQVSGRLAPRATVEMESHSGQLVLRVPSGTPAEFDLGSFSGSIRNRLTGDEPRSERWSNSLRFRVGEGTARVRMNTFSGTLTVEPMG